MGMHDLSFSIFLGCMTATILGIIILIVPDQFFVIRLVLLIVQIGCFLWALWCFVQSIQGD